MATTNITQRASGGLRKVAPQETPLAVLLGVVLTVLGFGFLAMAYFFYAYV